MYLNPTIIELYGPLAVRIYGLMAVIGLLLFMFLTLRDKRRIRYIKEDLFHEAFLYGIIAGAVGSRLFAFATDYRWQDGIVQFFKFWEPGFSLLGGVIAVPLVVCLYVWYQGVDPLLFFDIVIVYIPLMQAIARLGCFGAGCCYGMPVVRPAWWTVMYEHPDALAPLRIPLHPTQLYSAVASLTLFALLYFVSRRVTRYHGFISGLYLLGEGLARFFVDFWRMRSDYEVTYGLQIYEYHVTYYQGICLVVSAVGVVFVVASLFFLPKRARE